MSDVPYLAGSLGCLSAPELLGLANTTLKTCTIAFHIGEHRKRVWLREGQLVYASSSDPLDRLGPTLLRIGVITHDALAAAEGWVQGGRKLGRVLVDEGVLQAPDVYQGIAEQVRHIVLTIFDAPAGEFRLEESGAAPPSEVKLSQRTRDLLLEAVKRPEQLARAETLVPDLGAVPEKVPSPAAPGPRERAVFARVDGQRTAAAVIEVSRVGAFHGRLSLAVLVEAGLVRLRGSAAIRAHRERVAAEIYGALQGEEPELPAPGPASVPAGVAGPFEVYRRALRHVFDELRTHTRTGHHNLDLYLLDPRSGELFEDLTFGESGELDLDRLLDNARASAPEPLARARALDALEKLLSYALFEVHNLMPESTARGVLAEVQRLQGGVSRS